MTRKEIQKSNDIEQLRAECIRLRQGLWDCAALSGMDTDGNSTPNALVSDIVDYATKGVDALRVDYNECCG